MARYSRRETSAMPAGPAATTVSSGLCRGRDGARSCRPSYGGVLTLAFLPLGALLVFQQGPSNGSAEAGNTPGRRMKSFRQAHELTDQELAHVAVISSGLLRLACMLALAERSRLTRLIATGTPN